MNDESNTTSDNTVKEIGRINTIVSATVRNPISSDDCKHDYTLFIQSRHITNPPVREHVYVCADCGTFLISKTMEGVHIEVDFQLTTWEQVTAACQWMRYMESLN